MISKNRSQKIENKTAQPAQLDWTVLLKNAVAHYETREGYAASIDELIDPLIECASFLERAGQTCTCPEHQSNQFFEGYEQALRDIKERAKAPLERLKKAVKVV